MKLTRFSDIPQFTDHGQWECDYTPDRLIKQVDEWVGEGLDLDPDFQRGHVWTPKQQTSYVEFFLRGGKTARVLYFNNPAWMRGAKTGYTDFVIVDGLQRLTAFRAFINNEIKVFGSYFREYTQSFRMGTNTVKVNMNDLQTRAEVLQWYLDFNSGGTVHSDEELARVSELLKAEKKGAKRGKATDK